MIFAPGLVMRDLQPELMDQPELDAERHVEALDALARVNAISNSAGILWPPIRELCRKLCQDRPGVQISILDVASGGGDVTVDLWKRAQRAGFNVRVEGWDISPRAIEYAETRARTEGAEVAFTRRDVLGAPWQSSFDVVYSSLFLHHLDQAQAVELLRRKAEAAKELVLVNDLVRCTRGYMLAWLGSRLLTRSPVAQVDGPRSVAGAFRIPEARQLAERAGLSGAQVVGRWPCRYLLSWQKTPAAGACGG
jgi:SAM-dependent methyltransferase